MTLVIISLVISFIITILGIVYKDKDGDTPLKAGVKQPFLKRLFINPKSRNAILILLNFLFLFITYWMIKDDSKESAQLKTAVNESKQLLQDANLKMTKQADIIVNGFADLKGQISQQGMLSGNIDRSIRSLTVGIETYTNESKELFSSLNQSLTSKSKGEFFTTPSIVSIPRGHKNSVEIDAQNFIAVVKELDNNLRVTHNGRTFVARPAVPYRYTDAQGNQKHFVYNGIVNDKYEFTLINQR
jgi:hypothetical protein